jgi:hypothetical protein
MEFDEFWVYRHIVGERTTRNLAGAMKTSVQSQRPLKKGNQHFGMFRSVGERLKNRLPGKG